MQEDAIRWDKRHAQGFMPQSPSAILREFAPLLRTYTKRGRANALDIACGNGRNAKFLAKLGFSVLGVDISQVALDSLQGVEGVRGLCVDRRLFRGIKEGIKRGGIVVFETFCAVPKIYDREIFSQLPAHRSLQNGELERAFSGWKILHNAYGIAYRSASESSSQNTQSTRQNVYLTQSFVARKP